MIRSYTRSYVFYQEIEDDNIRRIIDDYQVEYGRYNDVTFLDLTWFLEDEDRYDDTKAVTDFMGNNGLGDNHEIDMSMI